MLGRCYVRTSLFIYYLVLKRWCELRAGLCYDYSLSKELCYLRRYQIIMSNANWRTGSARQKYKAGSGQCSWYLSWCEKAVSVEENPQISISVDTLGRLLPLKNLFCNDWAWSLSHSISPSPSWRQERWTCCSTLSPMSRTWAPAWFQSRLLTFNPFGDPCRIPTCRRPVSYPPWPPADARWLYLAVWCSLYNP